MSIEVAYSWCASCCAVPRVFVLGQLYASSNVGIKNGCLGKRSTSVHTASFLQQQRLGQRHFCLATPAARRADVGLTSSHVYCKSWLACYAGIGWQNAHLADSQPCMRQQDKAKGEVKELSDMQFQVSAPHYVVDHQ